MLRQVDSGADSRQIVADHINSNLGDNTTVSVARTTDLQLNPMNTTEKISFTAENVFSDDFDGNQVISTINYEGLNLWWQMENLPSYLKSWQSVSQVMNKMNTQNFQNFFYSHIMSPEPYFANQTWVFENVLNVDGMDNVTQEAIYTDQMYGMNNTRKLTIWIAAHLGDVAAQTALAGRFFGGIAKVDPTQLAAVYGPTSQFHELITQINLNLLAQGVATDNAELTNENLSLYQWANGNMLNNFNLSFSFNQTTWKPVSSMMDIGMNFLTPPEIANTGC